MNFLKNHVRTIFLNKNFYLRFNYKIFLKNLIDFNSSFSYPKIRQTYKGFAIEFYSKIIYIECFWCFRTFP